MITKKSIYLFILAIASVTGVAIRIVEFNFAIEQGTGFYKSDSFSVLVLNIIIIAFILVMFTAFLIIKKDELQFEKTMDVKNSSTSKFILSILFAFSIVQAFLYALGIPAIIKKGDFLGVISILFAVALVGFFLAMLYYNGKMNGNSYLELLVLVPLCWSLVRLISTFLKYTGIANISTHLFEVIMLAFFVLFFLTYAKVITGRGNERAMFVFGVCSIFGALITALPQMVLILMDKLNINDTLMLPFATDQVGWINPFINSIYFFMQALDLFLALFILVVLVGRNKNKEIELPEYNEFEDDTLEEYTNEE